MNALARFALIILLAVPGPCLAAEAPAATEPARKPIGPQKIGEILHRPITEASGIIASRKFPGVFWVHCDSGNDAAIYAITRDGKLVAEYPVNVKNDDWEDIATDDDGHLYIGDIGGGKRKNIFVYRVDEPDPTKGLDANKIGPKLKVDVAWKLSFPDQPFDCESLFVFKDTGYVISKHFVGLPAAIYKFPLDTKQVKVNLEKVATLGLHSPVTAADISPDGKRLAVLTNLGLNVYTINGDVASASKAKPAFTRLLSPGIEGCTFVSDGVLVVSESRELFLFPDPETKKP